MFSLFKKDKKKLCLLITPPLLEPNSFYPAMPLLCGQLEKAGYSAENLDLNIKFFNKVLSVDYIKKTEKILKEKGISYDFSETDFLVNNIKKSIDLHRENKNTNETDNIICKTLKFITKPYPNFIIEHLSGFENCFLGCNYTYPEIKDITNDDKKNIFVAFYKELINEIKKKNPLFIAITVPFIGTLIPALTLAKLLKKHTNLHICIGGNFLKKEDIIKHPDFINLYCDSILTGDGEESIVKLAKYIEKEEKIENIQGLIYKDSNNKLCFNDPIPITNMNHISPPSFNGINFNEYLLNNPYIYIMLSKGCYWGKCTFCSLATKYNRYCIKTPQEAVKEIKEIKEKYNIKGWFLLQDDSIPPQYMNMFADEIFKENLDIYYTIFGRLEKGFSKDLLQKLYNSGLRSIYWGLESGCQKVLNDMNKGIQLEDVPEILKNAYEIGISNLAGIIINFPTETMEDFIETINFIEKIKDFVTISPGNFAVMKNSIIAENSDKYGIKIIQNKEFSYTPEWQDIKLSNELKNKKWMYFLNCIKSHNFQFDSNKNLFSEKEA